MQDNRPSQPAAASRGGKYLTFCLGREEYGIEILKVQEIIGLLPATPIPRAPAFIKGVINLRGKIIPVMDLRLKLGMEEAPRTEETCIIIIKTQVDMGIIVDRVSEVLDIADTTISDAPAIGGGVNTEFILGIAKAQDGVKLLLAIDKVLSHEEIMDVAAAGGQQQPTDIITSAEAQ